MRIGRTAGNGRRGTAGIVAVVLIFAILFSVGTGYFIFVNSQNASYVQSLLASAHKVQDIQSEDISVMTLLTSNGDVAFLANNTSSATVNMTAVLLVSSTGSLLKCDGVGFPAGSGCTNSTPALWMTINAGAGSPSIDTGYVYVAGTTDTLKVLTARGNVFTSAYPAPASSTGASQSVTVNLDNLKWVQLLPQASSLAQKNFVANCNNANCAAAYTSSVTAGNVLVAGIGWGNHAPPSTPTDTLGDQFTLGASQSVGVPAASALVQKQYTSNCNAAACGLAFTSSVTSGNTLIFSLGWANQTPPSAPSDTRGDSFTLGASKSLTVNPNSPTAIQERYLANCNSASCGLAFTSSVTAGNTLVYGLGWYSGGLRYVPITLTNNQASATANPFQQKITWNPSTYSAYEASDLGNIRFCADSACATTLDAWLETCTSSCIPSATSASAWVKLTSAISGSGGQLTIYMIFQATTVEFDANYWGEAPALSASYGLYDNGANVFSKYWNFAGTSLPTGWSSSTTATVNNHLSISAGAVYTTSTAFSSLNTVEEMYAEYTSLNSGGYSGIMQSSSQSPQGNNGGSAGEILWMTVNGANTYAAWAGDGSAASYNLQSQVNPSFTPTLNTFYVLGTFVSSTQVGETENYGTLLTASGTYTKSQYIILGYYSGSSAGTTSINPITIQWVHTRALPPSNVMPSVSFGSLTGNGSNPPNSITDTQGDTFTQGVSQSVSTAFTPSLVQKGYLSNCNSASCQLGFSNPVTAGNTLVFGLGWYGTLSYVPITLTNNQGTATPTTFQQKVTWNPSSYSAYEASDLGNVRFCADSACATTLNAWLESCTASCNTSATSASAWVKLTSAISGSGGTQTIYMVFKATNVDFDTNFWGEAPNLSGTYGQYDNGANVFNFYDNFAGTALSNKWTVVKSAGGSVSVNNGATFTTAASTDYAFVDSATQAYPQVAESYMVSRGGTTDPMLGVTSSSSANNHPGLYNGYSLELIRFSGTDYLAIYAETSGGGTLAPFSAETWHANSIWQVIWSATGTESATDGSISLSGTDATATIGNYGIYLGQGANSAGSDVSDWGRLRAYPPSNVMPSTSFGSLTGGTTPSSVTDTLSNSFTLGVSNTVTSGSSTYYSHIWYATTGSTGADTITATFGSAVTGSVSIYELYGVSASGPPTSTGSSSAGSTAIAVTSFTPASNSVVIGNAESAASTSAFTAGTGYTLAGTCAVVYGCSEYQTGVGSATTASLSLVASAGWVETAIAFGPATTTFNSYIWYGTAASNGADTITATFSSPVTGSESIYELTGISITSPSTSTGSSSGGSTTAAVGSFTPSSNSIVIGNTESASATSAFTAGAGFTLSGACSSGYGCGEFQTGVGSATTVPFTLGASTPWAESAISFAPLTVNTFYSYVWYATASSGGADTITASFGQSVAGSISIYELSGVTATGLLTSTGSSTTSQTSASVTSITPGTGSVVIGNVETLPTTYTAGTGYTLAGSCTSISGCGEYQTGVGSATTVPMSVSPASPWVEAALAFAPTVTTYYSYVWYATASSSGADTITAAFGTTVSGSVSIYELSGYTTSGVRSSTGTSSTGSTSSAVASFTPASNSFTVGDTEGVSASTTFTATTGYTLVGTCTSVAGCSEYNAGGGGSATTIPLTLSGSTPWVESALSFSTPFNPQSGIQVGGYPTAGVPSGAQLAWEVTFTNVDPQHRSVTVWPQTELAVGLTGWDGYDIDYVQEHYYLIDSLNPGTSTVNAYTSTNGQYLTLAYGVPTTLFFSATQALGTTTQAFGTEVLTPFEAYFALTGIFSDGTLFGETIPYPYGIVTQANAYTTPTVGATAATVTISCTSPCHYTANAKAVALWINAAGQSVQLASFTMNASGNIPAGVTFAVPTATAGYYTIEVTDYTNSIFMTFQHT